MEYVDINKLQLEEKNGLDIMDLIGVHDLMNDSKNSVAEEIIERFEKGESLPAMAFSIVFEHLDYFREIHEEINVLQKIMKAEKENKLPKLRAFEDNAEILANYYIDALDNYIDMASDVSDWISYNLIDKNISFLSEFCLAKGLDSNNEKETLHEYITDWHILAGDKIADYTLTKKAMENIPRETINEWMELALKYNPDCVAALKFKIDYLKMQRVK